MTGSCPPFVFSGPALLLFSLAMSMLTKIIDETVSFGAEGGACQEIIFDKFWSKRIVLKLFGVYAGIGFVSLESL